MNVTRHLKYVLAVCWIWTGLLGYVPTAHAYLDPGTGSMILQALIAGVATAVTVISIYWHKFKAFFTKKKAGPSEDFENDKSDV